MANFETFPLICKNYCCLLRILHFATDRRILQFSLVSWSTSEFRNFYDDWMRDSQLFSPTDWWISWYFTFFNFLNFVEFFLTLVGETCRYFISCSWSTIPPHYSLAIDCWILRFSRYGLMNFVFLHVSNRRIGTFFHEKLVNLQISPPVIDLLAIFAGFFSCNQCTNFVFFPGDLLLNFSIFSPLQLTDKFHDISCNQ